MTIRSILSVLLCGAALGIGSPPVSAIPIQFDYAASNGRVSYTGFMVIDDSLLDGSSFQGIAQSDLLDFSMTATRGEATFTWDMQDLIPTSYWFFDSSGGLPDVVGQGGYISRTNRLIGAGTGAMHSSYGRMSRIVGDWTVGGAGATSSQATRVPEPATWALLVLALAGLALARHKHR